MQSNSRIAELLVQLMSGQHVEVTKVLEKYGISKRTYQRDFAFIRDALLENNAGELCEHAGCYWLKQTDVQANYQKALIMSHVLLGSRALTVDELKATLDYLAQGLPAKDQSELRRSLRAAKGSYVPLSQPQPLLKRLSQMTQLIAGNQRVTFTYDGSAEDDRKPQTANRKPQTANPSCPTSGDIF
ncbi:hypothetical protein [Lactiplantibacillus modestisalitolerans]|uniref:Transcriptional regulator n=1 Tax=Lactiplantibacillus modestisalitolerans TaxID=1457219 RepID=A0ABV5WSF0_9LACO|nr:hypothetical protein [Lactiplantibacillus modestisalitolerans]